MPLCPSDFTVPEDEILKKEDELIALFRRNATEMDLGEAISESEGNSQAAIRLALRESDSMMLGQACIAALFDYLRKQMVEPRMRAFIKDRQEQLYHEHEDRIRPRASNE